MSSLRLVAPVGCLCAFAFALFGLDAWTRKVTQRNWRSAMLLALAGLGVTGITLCPLATTVALIGRGMMVWDGLSYFFSWIALLTLFFVVLMSSRYREFAGLRMGPYFGLLLLAGAGVILLVSSNDFLMIFLGIELIGVPSFIVAGFLRDQERSSEAAVKFFLIGAFSSAMLVYGISIIYGITGSMSLTDLQRHWTTGSAMGALGLIGIFFVIVSFGFKIALVPFHMWVPDVFEGSPKPIAAFLSVAPKVAGAAIALRVFNTVLPFSAMGMIAVLAGIAALTMTTANLIALQQTNIIRLLAYSSIAHMGYLLLGLVGGEQGGISGVYLYGLAYLLMNLGAFAVVIALSGQLASDDLSAYAGLAHRAPGIAALLTLFLASLAGIPPTVGFLAKFYVFLAAFQAGWVWLVALAALNSVISVAYYFKIVHWMYFKPAASSTPAAPGFGESLAVGLAAALTIAIGVAPQYVLPWTQRLAIGPHP